MWGPSDAVYPQCTWLPAGALLQTFGVLLYAAGRWCHLDLEHGVFTARLEVDYKKVGE